MADICYPFEPFKIKTMESIPITTRDERVKILRDAKGNIFRVPARGITIDLLTDSGTGAMSDAQWGALLQGDESYAGSKSWELLNSTAQEVFGMPYILPAHQGRGAEHLLFTVMLDRDKKPVIPGNGHFDTTSGHIEWAGGIGVDCIGEWADDPDSDYPFKGDMSPEKLREVISEYGVDRIPLVLITITANTAAGQPVSLGGMKKIREVCDEYGSVLIFDEVMTGFRVGPQGAQGLYDVTPDLTCLGKVIGGGMPVGAFGGKREIMEHISPLGPVYQAGTLAGNPVTMAAGVKTLELIGEPGFYETLTARTENLVEQVLAAAKEVGVPMTANQVGGMFGFFFTEAERVENFYQVTQCDKDRFNLFFHGMLEAGHYLAPSAFEAGFVSGAHGCEDIDATAAAAKKVLASL